MTATSYWPPAAREGIEIFEAEPVHTAVIRRDNFPMADMKTLFDEGLSLLIGALLARGIAPIGPAFSLHNRVPRDTADIEVGVPIATALTETIDVGKGYEVIASIIPGGKVAGLSHIGSYSGLGDAWGTLMGRLMARDMPPSFPFWEVYVTEPSPDMDVSTLRTDLYSALK